MGSGIPVDAHGFQAMARAMALVALPFRTLGIAGAWRDASRDQAPAEIGFCRGLRQTFANVWFRRFLPTLVLFQVALQMPPGSLPFLVVAVLGREEEGAWSSAPAAAALGCTVLGVPAFLALARRTSKRRAYRAAMLGAALAFPLLALPGLPPGAPVEAQAIAAVALMARRWRASTSSPPRSSRTSWTTRRATTRRGTWSRRR